MKIMYFRGIPCPYFERLFVKSLTEPLIDLSDWDVLDCRGMWMGRINLNAYDWAVKKALTFQGSRGYIAIMPTSFPWEIAVDALLDFMTRLKYGNLPRGVDDPQELMQICVIAARRQR